MHSSRRRQKRFMAVLAKIRLRPMIPLIYEAGVMSAEGTAASTLASRNPSFRTISEGNGALRCWSCCG